MPNQRKLELLVLSGMTVGAPLFFWGGPAPTAPAVLKAVWNLGHVLFFGLMATWLHLKVAFFRKPQSARQLAILSVMVFGLGVGIEWAQYGVSREPDWHDICRNLLGCWLAWFWWARRNRTIRWGLSILALWLSFEVFLVGKAAWFDWNAQKQIFSISDLESFDDPQIWHGRVKTIRDSASTKDSHSKT